MVASLGGMTLAVVESVRQALAILDQLEKTGLLDPATVVDAATRSAASGDHRLAVLPSAWSPSVG